MSAAQPEATTTPVSSNRVGFQLPPPRDRVNTSSMVRRAPLKAGMVSPKPLRPSSIAVKTATAAPPEIPRI